MGTKDFDQASWWYREGDETHGPVNEAELRRLAAAGKLQSQSLVWREDYGEDWRTLDESGIVAATAFNSNPQVSESWNRVFARIEAAEGSTQTGFRERLRNKKSPFSPLGFICGPLYYFYLRMWSKGLLIFAFACFVGILNDLMQLLVSVSLPTKIVDLMPAAICGACVKRDYYMFKVHGESMWPWKPFRPLRSAYTASAIAVATFVVLLLVPDKGSPSVLADVSGVWSTAGLTMEVDIGGPTKRLVLNGRSVDVSVKSADSADGEVVLSPSTTPNKLITLRQAWQDAEHKRFKLSLLLDGRSAVLGYLRPLSGGRNLARSEDGLAQARSDQSASSYAPPVTRAADKDAGISGSYCSTGRAILESQTLQFRAQSIPVDDALDAFVKEDNFDYQQFMMASVRELYRNPDAMRAKLNDGGWMRACIEAVRGY